jgi:CDP-diglyceride synthetase
MNAMTHALWLIAPILLAGLVHIAIIRLRLLPALARIPLDFGCTFRDRRLFGANKTCRGALIMIAGASGIAWAAAAISPALHRALSVADLQRDHPAYWGLLLGLGYVMGELPNSFVKRRLNIAPGDIASGSLGVACWLIDQIDSLLGVLIVLWLIWQPDAPLFLALLLVTLVLHPAVALVMTGLKLKRRIG